MSDESDLIAAARAGSVVAFTELVHDYRERLLRFLLTRCANHADAEDALQDTFINAYRYLYSYDARWRFSTWLYRIAIRNAVQHGTESRGGIEQLADTESDPLQLCIDASERENLWLTARRLLRSDVYSAMWLRYVEDMSVSDIAAVLGRGESWVKVNLSRARKQLGAELQQAVSGSQLYG